MCVSECECVRCYLSLPPRAPLHSDHVGFTFTSPQGQETENTGNIYARLHFNHLDIERKKEGPPPLSYVICWVSRAVYSTERGQIGIRVCFCSDMDEELQSTDQSADMGREGGS